MTRLVGIGVALVILGLSGSNAQAAPKKQEIKWPASIEWVSFTDGQSNAALTGKPMLVLVYAHWCTQCVRLSKSMLNKDFEELSKNFIMVLVDQDKAQEMLDHYFPKMTYVPRIFFMKPDGEFWTELKSKNARYPYFYPSSDMTELMSNMNVSLKTHRGK